MKNSHDNHKDSADGIDGIFHSIFNDPLPPKNEDEEKAPAASSPAASSQIANAESRSGKITPSHLASQQISQQLHGTAPKADSAAVRDLSNVAALHQASTRLGDFSVEKVSQPSPQHSSAPATPSTPPPMPASSLGLQPQKVISAAAEHSDFTKAMNEGRYEDGKSVGKWMVVMVVFLALLTFRSCNQMREPYYTLESELAVKISQSLRKHSETKTIEKMNWRPQSKYEERSGIFGATVTYSDDSTDAVTATVQSTNIWGTPEKYKLNIEQ